GARSLAPAGASAPRVHPPPPPPTSTGRATAPPTSAERRKIATRRAVRIASVADIGPVLAEAGPEGLWLEALRLRRERRGGARRLTHRHARPHRPRGGVRVVRRREAPARDEHVLEGSGLERPERDPVPRALPDADPA